MIKENTVVSKGRISYTQSILHDFKKKYRGALDNRIKTYQKIFRTAQFWYADEDVVSLFINTAISAEAMREVRLPHKAVVLEYTVPDIGVTTDGQEDAPHRTVIMQEEHDGISMAFICYNPAEKVWVPMPTVNLPYKYIDDMDSWYETRGESEVGIHFKVFKFDTMYERMPEDQMEIILTESITDIQAVLAYLQLLNCANMDIQHVATDFKITRAARRRGKYAPPSFRHFNISDNLRASYHSATNEDGSPRKVHWRRGHIRMQPTNKGIIKKWIHPTIVGTGTPEHQPVIMTT
jgi:hypothetical protein